MQVQLEGIKCRKKVGVNRVFNALDNEHDIEDICVYV